MLEELKKYLKKRMDHAAKRVDGLKGNPNRRYDLGYWEGKLSTYCSILDTVKEMEKIKTATD
nr:MULTISPECIES: hypothetical protein [Bacillus amyloliquefaciens group]